MKLLHVSVAEVGEPSEMNLIILFFLFGFQTLDFLFLLSVLDDR